MQQWWKWLLACAVMGILLLLGGVLWTNTGSAEAAPTQKKAKAKPATDYWAGWNHPVSRVVPILTAGTPGIRLGLAQVTGPKGQVDRVKAVLQINADFKSARAKIFVPTDSYTDLRRVQGTAVSAVLQYRLLDFGSKSKARPAPSAPRAGDDEDACPPNCDKHHKHHDNGHHYGWYKQKNKKHDHDDD